MYLKKMDVLDFFLFDKNMVFFFFKVKSFNVYELTKLRFFLANFGFKIKAVKGKHVNSLFKLLCLFLIEASNYNMKDKENLLQSNFASLKGFFTGNIFYINVYSLEGCFYLINKLKSLSYFENNLIFPLFLKHRNELLTFKQLSNYFNFFSSNKTKDQLLNICFIRYFVIFFFLKIFFLLIIEQYLLKNVNF